MIPKIDYQTHHALTRVFLPPLLKEEEFEKRAKNFIKHFKKIEKEVLRLIEKFSGFKWTKNKIPVYLVPPGRLFSITKKNLEWGFPGVVQKVFEDFTRNTHILIHELSHVNQFQTDFDSKENPFAFDDEGKRNFMGLEICADVVCFNVLKELFGKNSEYEKDYWEFLNNVQNSTPGKEKEVPKYIKKWDLKKKTLREYIKFSELTKGSISNT